ncbi:HNH endonuclease signature motif containing protein [Nocardia sp. NPDC005825]|uniref:HNH endonuclease n=1 Tax=unclassified Nocardia TaxID=2637762 RepID=UPI0033C00CE8
MGVSRQEMQRRTSLETPGVTHYCAKCRDVRPIEEFSKSKSCRDGLMTNCKACEKQRVRGWRDDNPERTREYDRERYSEIRERKAAYLAEYMSNYRRERIANDPWFWRLEDGIARARKAGRPWKRFTTEQVLADWERRGVDPEACAYCGGEFEHIEHMVPLSRDGSPGHVLGNLAPSCARCNLGKDRKHWVEFLADRANTP